MSDHSGGKDAEPDLDLVQPAGIGRGIVEMDIGVTREPGAVFLLVGGQVIQHHVQFLIRGEGCQYLIHEIKKLMSSSTPVVPGPNHPGGDF